MRSLSYGSTSIGFAPLTLRSQVEAVVCVCVREIFSVDDDGKQIQRLAIERSRRRCLQRRIANEICTLMQTSDSSNQIVFNARRQQQSEESCLELAN